jgi:hypothetical protein
MNTLVTNFKIMKKLSLIAILIMVVLSACNRNDEIVNKTEPVQVVNLINSSPLTNQIILSKISTNVKNEYSLNKAKSALKSALSSLDLKNAIISEYENTEIRSVTIPISENLSYITYTKQDKVWEGGMLIEIQQENDTYYVKYYNLNKEVIGGLTVHDGIITDAYGIITNSTKSSNSLSKVNGWWSDWGDCVGASLTKMTDGSVKGSVWGLACIAFGPECAAGTALGCAAAATFN